MKKFVSISFVSIIALLALAALATNAGAYDTYSGCLSCHGSFTAGTYNSLAAAKATSPSWFGGLHAVHRNSSTQTPRGLLNGNCNACHSGTSRTPVYMSSSNGPAPFEQSCSGCHDGPGLRAHHVNSGADTTCYDCHSNTTPDPENILRPVYAATFGTTNGTTSVNDPCNPAAAGFEGRLADVTTVGLDNDGNLLYDQNDPACKPVAPVLSASPTTLTFGSQNVGTTSSSQTVTISNTGTADMTVNSITNSNTVNFALASTATPFTVNAGASATFTMTFTPGSAGAKSATVSLGSNGGSATVSATGTGLTPATPAMSVSPTTLSFGNQNVGATSATKTVTISNTGAGTLNVGSIYSSSTEFGFSPSTLAPIAAGGSATLSITFSPASAGAKSASISITSDGGNGAVSVSGTGVTPSVSVPNVVGMTQSAATAAITGAGLTVGTVTTQSSSTVPAGQVISQNPTAGANVASGSAVNLVVSSGSASVSVPNVVGMTQSAATSAITGAGLTVGTVTTQSSSTVLAGQVISQSPAAGTSVALDSAVNLIVSSGSGTTDGDVSLVKMTAPTLSSIRDSRSVEVNVFGATTVREVDATVALTASAGDGVTVRINHPRETEELKAGETEKFEFDARITCIKRGAWPVTWTATISAAKNSNPANDTLTGTTQVTCTGSGSHDHRD